MGLRETLLLMMMMMLLMSLLVVAHAGDPISDLMRMIDHERKLVGLNQSLVDAEKNTKIITVRKDGKGDFNSIRDAVKSIPEHNTNRIIIKIGPGVYNEKVFIDRFKPFVTLYGEDPHTLPTIVYGATAAQVGTWDSATFAVESEYFMAVNIAFENSAPMPNPGVEGGQAVAMRMSADKAAFYNCRFLGFQDTLLDDVGRHFFKDCFIQGMVDYIFGKGKSIYLNCELHTVSSYITAITAQGRAGKEDNGFVFIKSMVSGTGPAFLGRAWKESSRVVFAYCYMGNLIVSEGWDNFGHPQNNGKIFYAEYQSSGPGSNTTGRVPYSKILTGDQAKPFLSMSYISSGSWLLRPPQL